MSEDFEARLRASLAEGRFVVRPDGSVDSTSPSRLSGRSGSRSGDRRHLPDGTENPLYRSRSGQPSGSGRYRRFTTEGEENPRYLVRSGRRPKFERAAFVAVDGEGRNDTERSELVTRKVPLTHSEEQLARGENAEVRQARNARARIWSKLRDRVLEVCRGVAPNADYDRHSIPAPVYRPRTGVAPDVVAQVLGFEGDRELLDHLNAVYEAYREAKGWRYDPLYDHWSGQAVVNDHRFVLLSTSTGSHVRDLGGLSTMECLSLLIQDAQRNVGSFFVAYSAVYDFECILRDLPRAELHKLWEGKRAFWRGFVIEYMPRHHLWVQDTDARRTHSYEPVSVRVYDVIGFFQQSFLKTLGEWYPECPDLDLIERGKAARGHFEELNDETFEDLYNDAENRALVVVMDRFREALREAGISVTRWDGAGAISASLLKREGVKAHMTRTRVLDPAGGVDERGRPLMVDRDDIPTRVREAALHAYFGARIELCKAGNHQDATYSHDLNSAYPWALPDLPSLRGGRWTERQGEPAEIRPFALYHVRWFLLAGAPFHPFPFRTSLGTIIFPKEGEGWYWGPEVAAALRHHPRGIRIIEWIDFEPATDERPFAFVSPLASHRLELKHLPPEDPRRPANKPLKLGLNGIPGKLAQQRGAKFDSRGRPTRIPPYFQPEWAGYVISKTRAAVYEVAMQRPEAIISFNTDGVYATAPLQVEQGEALGQWETGELDWFITVQSGVYFYPDVDAENGIGEHYRGFDRASIRPQRVIEAWETGQPILECSLTRMVTLGQALAHKGDEAEFKRYWLTWRKAPRLLRLDLLNGKRHGLGPDRLRAAAHGLVDTKPRSLPNPGMSEKTRLSWVFEKGLLDQPDEEYDGTMLSRVLADYEP